MDKRTIARIICRCAKKYKENLVGNTFLYVLEDGRRVEVMFLKRNFKHLTGVDSPLSADEFYKKATRNELGESQVWFTAERPKRLSLKKLKHLISLSEFVLNDVFMLEIITTATRIYRFGTTDMNVTLCLDDCGNHPCFVPTSIRDEDCFSKSKNVFVVTQVWKKANGDKHYSELIYDNSLVPHYHNIKSEPISE